MNNATQSTKFYIKPSLEIYGKDGVESILEAFRELDPDTERGQMGAGAAGLMPELEMTLIAGASLIGVGFLNALGDDIYKLIKSGILRLIKIKPRRDFPSLPPNYKGEVYTQLFCWIYFDDVRIMFELNLQSLNSVEEALLVLPVTIDSIATKENKDFRRLLWDGKKWIILQ